MRLAIIAAAVDVAGLPSLQKKCSTFRFLDEEPRTVAIMKLESTDFPAPVVVAIVSDITSLLLCRALTRLAMNPQMLSRLDLDHGIELLRPQHPDTSIRRSVREITVKLYVRALEWVQPSSTFDQSFTLISCRSISS